MKGIPNWQYLFPIKMMGIVCALTIGNAFYYGSKQITVFSGVNKAIKYVSISLLLFGITYLLKAIILNVSGFDITPFIGID